MWRECNLVMDGAGEGASELDGSGGDTSRISSIRSRVDCLGLVLLRLVRSGAVRVRRTAKGSRPDAQEPPEGGRDGEEGDSESGDMD